MRKTVMVIVLAGLPSLLTAVPTLSVYLDDNEPGVGIRPRQAIDFSAAGVYGWLGRLDLLQTTRTHTPPLYPHLLSKAGAGILWTIPAGMDLDPSASSFVFEPGLPSPLHYEWESVPHPSSLGKPLDARGGRNLPRLVVLELVGERPRIEPTFAVRSATLPRQP